MRMTTPEGEQVVRPYYKFGVLCVGAAQTHENEWYNNRAVSPAFDRFLGRLGRARSGHRFVVAVDEFELFEEQIVEGRLEPHLLAAFRATFQTYPWFIMIFAGLHRLEELRQDYWNPLFASVTAIEVGFLSERAARVLITSPSPDFAIDYDSDAIARILSLTHGQPYLIQLICHSLVARYNRQVVEDPTPPQRRFILADVEAVVAQQELFRDGLLDRKSVV